MTEKPMCMIMVVVMPVGMSWTMIAIMGVLVGGVAN